MNAIEFKNFSCYYKGKKEYITALSALDLSVEQGELLVVVGESGSGKTTLLKSCLGMADFFEGELFIDGVTIEDIDLKTSQYAYVSQEFSLYPNLTVYENIAFPLRIMRTTQKEVDKRVKEIAELVDISFLLTRKPRHISIGQQQRVAIARALIKNPSFIFFDEPFANIDGVFRKELRALVKKIHGHFKPTVVFVTHDISEAFFLADRIAVLEDGKLVELATPEEILETPKSELMKHFLSARSFGKITDTQEDI